MGTSKSSMNPISNDPTRPLIGRERASADLANENSDEIREEIASTRDRMDDTLDELGNRLNPRRVIDDAMNLLSSSGTRDVAAKAGESALIFSENLGRVLRDNPVPTLLVGAGLAWLAIGNSHKAQNNQSGNINTNRSRRSRSSSGLDEYSSNRGSYRNRQLQALDEDVFFQDEYADFDDNGWDDDEREILAFGDDAVEGDSFAEDTSTESLADRAKQVAAQATGSASRAASSVGEAVADTAAGVSETVKHAASSAVSAVSSAASSVTSGLASAGDSVAKATRKTMRRGRKVGSQAYRYGGQTRSSLARGIHDQQEHMSDLWQYTARRYEFATEAYPLAVGMGCLAVGMLTGLLVPGTRYEDQWIGAASDDLKDDIRQTGEQVAERGKQLVSGAVTDATQAAESHGLSGGDLLARGERVVSKALAAAGEALEEEHLTPRELVDNVKQVAGETAEKVQNDVSQLGEDAKNEASKADPDLKRAADAVPKGGHRDSSSPARPPGKSSQ